MSAALQPLEVGICSWSAGSHLAKPLQRVLRQLSVLVAQLGVAPLLDLPATKRRLALKDLASSGINFSAAMISFPGEDYSDRAAIKMTGGLVPTKMFPARLRRAADAAKVCQTLGIGLLSMHVGFIPQPGEKKAFTQMLDRVRKLADALAKCEVTLVLETGQETAPTLLALLEGAKRRNLGVNFDPANMVLYGSGSPTEAAELLAPWVKHVHAKDARKSRFPLEDAWRGTEAPLGAGDAELVDVIRILYSRGYLGPLVIERESGNLSLERLQREVDFLRDAVERLRQSEV